MAEDQDLQLAREFIAGNENAFNTIVNKYQKKIYWHARRMLGNHMDADEVTQEVLIVIYQKLKDFNFKSSLYTWIYKITSTRSINQINRRKLKKLIFFEDSDHNTLTSGEDIISNMESKEKLQALEKVLLKLPVKQREIFLLRHFEEMTYEEISEVTGKSVGGLKANYFHALKKVMENMGNETK